MIRSWKNIALTAATVAGLALAAGCDSMKHKDSDSKKMDTSGGDKSAVANLKTAEAATTRPAWGKPTGTVTFTQSGEDKVKVAYDLKGLTPGKHGFHIHDKGDVSAPDLSSAGPHFNPSKHKHAGPDAPERHAGDLGNVEADSSGNAKGSETVEGITVGGGAANDIVGKSVILHEKADDLKTDPSGNSGGRVAGGVIEMKK
jgi:Cu-Zn family superoxide dismutase